MSERDIPFHGTFEEALAATEAAANELGGSVVLNDFGPDFRAGHLQLNDVASAELVFLAGDSSAVTIRVDVRNDTGRRLCDELMRRM